jgi:low affinity Fe/Cu permease
MCARSLGSKLLRSHPLGPVKKKSSWFSDFARKAARVSGQPVVFALAGGVVVVWLVSGPLFGFSDTWQLVINTGTSVVTFLMVFLIQNTQDRDSEAMHIKLDELIRSIEGAHNALLNLENLTPTELDHIRSDYIKLAREAQEKLQEKSTDTPEQGFHGDCV